MCVMLVYVYRMLQSMTEPLHHIMAKIKHECLSKQHSGKDLCIGVGASQCQWQRGYKMI